MADLPKRGDRVRVTELLTGSFLQVGDEITLTEDARPCPNWGVGACECIYEGRNGNGFGRTWSGAVKVEILGRATTDGTTRECFTCAGLGGFNGMTELCPRCNGSGIGPERPKNPGPDYTRGRRDGMRRTLELIEQHLCYCQGWAEFDEAVAKELAND